MEINKINKAANILYNSRINLKRIEKLPNDCEPKSLKEAYLIQDELTKIYLSADHNNKLVGKKIACTNKEAQAQLNVTESFIGNMFLNNISKSNTEISPNFFFSPFVEPEFSFKMKKELEVSKAPFDFNTVYEAIDVVLPSIELVDSRYLDWTIVGTNNLIADNAVHAHWIYGESKNNLNIFDFYNHSVDLFINNKLIERGNSSNVMENPVNSLTWLINNLAQNKKTLPKDYFITTGTCTKAIPIAIGDNVKADFGNLGNVSFSFKE